MEPMTTVLTVGHRWICIVDVLDGVPDRRGDEGLKAVVKGRVGEDIAFDCGDVGLCAFIDGGGGMVGTCAVFAIEGATSGIVTPAGVVVFP